MGYLTIYVLKGWEAWMLGSINAGMLRGWDVGRRKNVGSWRSGCWEADFPHFLAYSFLAFLCLLAS